MIVTFDSKRKNRQVTVEDFQNKELKRPLCGCLTCKVRKKKCDESRPMCGDCKRLGKECIWIDGKSSREIKKLRSSILQRERCQKLRHRVIRTLSVELIESSTMAEVPETEHNLALASKPIVLHKHASSPQAGRNDLVISVPDKFALNSPSPRAQSDIDCFGTSTANEALFSPKTNDIINTINGLFTSVPPSPDPLPDLGQIGLFLYDYYVHTLSLKLSIAPMSQDGSNSYQSVFLPLAQKDRGVLFGILAWSGFYLGGDWAKEGKKYSELALNHLQNSNTKKSHNRISILVKLATLLILCGAEICRGDIKTWSVYLFWGWETFYTNGGICNFNKTREEYWLASNFVYHDLLASSAGERGTYFPLDDYDEILRDPLGVSRGSLSPILGVSKKLYRVIGDINTLSHKTKELSIMLKQHHSLQMSPQNKGGANVHDNDNYDNENLNDDNDNHNDNDFNEYNDNDNDERQVSNRILNSVLERAEELKFELLHARPDPADLMHLTNEELELQLSLFEAFQISIELFLRQAVLQCNPSTLKSQVLVNDLLRCLEIMVGTSVQASLVFPLFICGIHCVSHGDRHTMLQLCHNLLKTYGASNVSRVKAIMEKVWELNPAGDKAVDWHFILKDLDWDINFA